MKSIRFLIALYSILLVSIAQAQYKPVHFYDALKSKLIRVKSASAGCYMGPCLGMEIVNLSSVPLEIDIPAGTSFICDDAGAQDLLVIQSRKILLDAKKKMTDTLVTMCLENFNYSPPKGATFQPDFQNKYARLKKVADYLDQKKNMRSSGQAAVWSVSNNTDILSIYDDDSIVTDTLRKLVSQITGRPIPVIKKPIPPVLRSCRINFRNHFPQGMSLSSAIYDSTGKEIFSYYKNKPLPQGSFIATIGFNILCAPGEIYYIRIKDDKNGKLLHEKRIDADIMEDYALQYQMSVKFAYSLKSSIEGASLKLFDTDGNLMETIWENRTIPEGIREQTHQFDHAYGTNTVFYYKLFSKEGKLLYTYKIDSKNSIIVPRNRF